MKDTPFNLPLGDAPSLGITPGTNSGVTVAIDPSTQTVTVDGILSTNTTLTFGNVDLDFSVVSFPLNQSTNLQF